MNDDDVTPVTRNQRTLPPEAKLAIDFVAGIAMLYYATHPWCLDDLQAKARRGWAKVTHYASIWAARAEIRSLPDTEDN